MYCKACGMKNDDDAQYCINDGVSLTAVGESSSLYRLNAKFCQKCRNEISHLDLYCTACGESTEKTKEKETQILSKNTPRTSRIKNVNRSSLMNFLFEKKTLFSTLLYLCFSVISLLIVAAICSNSLNNMIGEMLEADIGVPLGELINLVSTVDVFTLFHMTSTSYTINSEFFELGFTSSSGLLLLMLAPGLVFFVVGFLMNKRMSGFSVVQKMVHHLLFAAAYGVVVGMIGTLASGTINLPDPTGFLGGIEIKNNFVFIESVFNSFVISFIFLTLGSTVRLSAEHLTNEGYGVSISTAIKHAMVGLVIMMGVGIVYVQTNEDFPIEQSTQEILVGSQLGGYLWNIVQFGTFKTELNILDETVSVSYSLLQGGKSTNPEGEEYTALFDWLGNGLAFWVILPVLLHIGAGLRLRKATQGNLLHDIGVYAIVFGIVNAVMVSISRLALNTSFGDAGNFSYGFSTFGTFIVTCIMAFCIPYAVVLLTNRRLSHHTEHRYQM